MKYRQYYKYTNHLGKPEHLWVVVGRHVGVHLHISEIGRLLRSIDAETTVDDEYLGGIEFHYRSPPPYMDDEAPSHDNCWILKAPCWHDGSSLQVSDFWIPEWLKAPHDHERMFKLLQGRIEEAKDSPGTTGEAIAVLKEALHR